MLKYHSKPHEKNWQILTIAKMKMTRLGLIARGSQRSKEAPNPLDSLGCVWLPAWRLARMSGCKELLFGSLHAFPNQARLVQKESRSQAREKRRERASLPGQAPRMQARMQRLRSAHLFLLICSPHSWLSMELWRPPPPPSSVLEGAASFPR